MLFLILCFVIFICVGELLIRNSRSGKLLSKVPEPWRLPLIGHGLSFYHTTTELFYMARAYSNKYKSAYKFGVAHMQVVNTLEPEDIEIILSNPKCINKSLAYKFMKPWINDGLLLSTGDKWKNRRKVLGSAFHYTSLKQFLFVFNENSEKLILKLKDVAEDTEVDIMDMIVECALYDICETAMGVNLDEINIKQKNVYKHAIEEMTQYMVYRAMRVWYHLDFIFGLSSIGKKQKKTLDDLHDFTSEVIRQRRELKTMKMSENFNEQDSKRRLTLLDLLITAETEGKIDDEGVREEVDTFMFGGHDTTTSSIIFCLMLLANNPSHQDIVYNEIIGEFGDDTSELTIAKFNNLSYLERCIKETLRLYPSVPLISRLIKEDIQLTKFTLPAGTTFQIHIYDLHRKASIYLNPDKFDPERFLPENCEKRHPYAYLPFSGGPRNCLGQKYTILEQKVIISSIIKNFKLEAITKPEDVIFTASAVLKPKYPIKIKLIPRC